ncbi:MAG: DUF721 domain-containing protein [Bdellovibrionales bacterium]|nr:DUF721 domain-containing protein [Bdellovibrionales bacterium]
MDTILSLALKRYGLEDKIHRYRFVSHWKEIVGEELAKRSRPERLRGKVLIVAVRNSAWAQEMSFLKNTILKRLNRFLDSDVEIEDVKFVVQAHP